MDSSSLVRAWTHGTLVAEFDLVRVFNDAHPDFCDGSARLEMHGSQWRLLIDANLTPAQASAYATERQGKVVPGKHFPQEVLFCIEGHDRDVNHWRFEQRTLQRMTESGRSNQLPTVSPVVIEETIESATVTLPSVIETPMTSVCFALERGASLDHLHRQMVETATDNGVQVHFLDRTQSICCGGVTLEAATYPYDHGHDLVFSTTDTVDAERLAQSLADALTFLLARPVVPAAVVRAGEPTTCQLRHHDWCHRAPRGNLKPLPNPGLVVDHAGVESFWKALPLYIGDLNQPRSTDSARLDQMWWQVVFGEQNPTWTRFVVICACIEACSNLLLPASNPRVNDLATSGFLTRQHVETWGQVRHRSVHGTIPKEIGDHEMGQLWVLHDALICCTLHAIGYSGKRKDFSTLAWPVVDFTASPAPQHRSSSVG